MAKKSSGTVSAKKRREQIQEKKRKDQIRLFSLIGLAAIIIIGGLTFISISNQGIDPTDGAALTEAGLVGIQYDGSPDAPVQIVEFGDFGCHACRAWHNAGAKQLLQGQFGDDIAFSFRHFPVITPQSPKAAEAGQCAAEQDLFWEYHDYIYEVTPEGALGESSLKQYAGDVGLDQASFDACLDSGKYADYIREDMSSARVAGARGTPTFLINGQQVSAQPDVMASVIESFLSE